MKIRRNPHATKPTRSSEGPSCIVTSYQDSPGDEMPPPSLNTELRDDTASSVDGLL